jgi:hypothetical protein
MKQISNSQVAAVGVATNDVNGTSLATLCDEFQSAIDTFSIMITVLEFSPPKILLLSNLPFKVDHLNNQVLQLIAQLNRGFYTQRP